MGVHALCFSSLLPLASWLTCLLRYTFQAQRDIIFELRRIAFDAESDPSNVPGSGTEKRKAMYTKDYKMLGFTVSTRVSPPSPDSSPFIVVALEQQTERGEGVCVQLALAVAPQWVDIIWAYKPDPSVYRPGKPVQQRERRPYGFLPPHLWG